MIYLFLKKISQTILICTTFLIVACSSSPISIELNPRLTNSQTTAPVTSKTPWQITSQDHRIAQYLIEVTKGEGVATLINDAQSSRLTIEQALQQKWHQSGVKFQAQSPHKINIQLVELLARIKQKTFAYTIDSNIVINVQLEANNNIFSKIFRSHSTQEAPFSPNIKKTGEQLNTQLSELLNEIIKDPELNAKF